MSFQVTKEINPQTHHATLTVTFDAKTAEKAKRAAARRLSHQIKIPGFRPGKAPYHLIVRRVGESAIWEEAIDDLLKQHYSAILEKAEVKPAYAGTLKEVPSLEPLTLVLEVPLKPEVELGDYQALRVPYEPPQVEEEEVERTLDNLRRLYISIDPVDRPAQMDDVVVMDMSTTIYPREGEEGEPKTLEEGEVALLVKEADDPEEWPFPGFGKALEGLQAGDEKELEYVYPADFADEELRGRRVVYRLRVKEVQAPTLPELTDEFVQENTEYQTVEELRAAIRKDLEARHHREYDDEYFRQILNKILEQSTLRIPEAMIQEEMQSLRATIAAQLQENGASLEQVLAQSDKSADEFEAELREAALRNLQQRLVLGEIARREDLRLSEDELQETVDAALQDLLNSDDNPKEILRFLRNEQALSQWFARAISVRTFAKAAEHLIRIAKGEAESDAETTAEAHAPAEAAPATEDAETTTEAAKDSPSTG